MMVVHEDDEMPVEVALIRKPLLEQKSYVIVKNHVRELLYTKESTSSVNINKEKSPEIIQNVEKKKRKLVKKLKNNDQIPSTLADSDHKTNIITEFDKDDIKELRTVYYKCKEVMTKIEAKYGHLLDLDCAETSSCRKRKVNSDEYSDDECNCKLTKKIVFDDDGNQSTVEIASEKHVCIKKVKKADSKMNTRSKNIAIEYTDNEISLPDNLSELGGMLRDLDIERPLRNKIINKMKSLKQDYVNEIRFNKHALIEKLKVNPDDVLAFKGTNLSSIRGYL